jgi:hypothetical protein
MLIVDTNQPLAEAELTARLHFQFQRAVQRSQGQQHTVEGGRPNLFYAPASRFKTTIVKTITRSATVSVIPRTVI